MAAGRVRRVAAHARAAHAARDRHRRSAAVVPVVSVDKSVAARAAAAPDTQEAYMMIDRSPAVPAGPAAAGRIAFVQSCWHRDIVDVGRDAFLAAMAEHGHTADSIDCLEVPGAFEIPLRAKMLAATGRYAAIVAGGLVVDGGIYRHDFVASAVIDGLMRVQLDTCVPVFSMVLTPHHFHEHGTHRDFFLAHFRSKGREAAEAVVGTLAGHDAILRAASAA